MVGFQALRPSPSCWPTFSSLDQMSIVFKAGSLSWEQRAGGVRISGLINYARGGGSIDCCVRSRRQVAMGEKNDHKKDFAEMGGTSF